MANHSIPSRIKPMLARDGEPFDNPDYLFETKWDGYRCLAFITSDSVRLQSRNLKDITSHFPELSELPGQLSAANTILDGELIALEDGRPSFHALQKRFSQRQADSTPVIYVIFDLLFLAGDNLCALPLSKRKEKLQRAIPHPGQHIVVTNYVIGSGKEFYQANIDRGMEGIMAKKLSSPYLPGQRSRHWLKIKRTRQLDAVIVGLIPKKSSLRSLILGLYNCSDQLVCIGLVGTGFSQAEAQVLFKALKAIRVAYPPVKTVPTEVPPSAVWVDPRVVCQIRYLELTPDGRVRHPRFAGIRTDKLPRECVFPTQ